MYSIQKSNLSLDKRIAATDTLFKLLYSPFSFYLACTVTAELWSWDFSLNASTARFFQTSDGTVLFLNL